MRKQGRIEIACKNTIYNMAKEDFKLERGPFVGVFGVFAMDFFIDPAYSVSVSYFEFGKILYCLLSPSSK